MTFISPEFCPFCGKRTLLDQGGDEDTMQLECVSKKCGVLFNLTILGGKNEEEE